MLDIFAQYATDESLELNGSWRSLGGDAEILVARNLNPRYSSLLSKLYAQNQQTLDLNAADGTEHPDALAKSEELMVEVIAKTILLGWKNLAYKGQPLEYSEANAKMLLKHRDFRRLVVEKSTEVDAYRVKQEEEQGKG